VNSAAPASPTRLRAALVRRAHGVRGEVRVDPLGGDWNRFKKGLKLSTEVGDRELRVRSVRNGGDGSALLGFEGVDDAAAAGALRGAYLTVDAAAARPLQKDEWFVWQLVGMRALNPDGEVIGVVEDVETAAGNDLLVVRSTAGEHRFPMVREFVQLIDVESRVVVVTPWPEDDA
jgi:16S rRNA processing protein RimM